MLVAISAIIVILGSFILTFSLLRRGGNIDLPGRFGISWSRDIMWGLRILGLSELCLDLGPVTFYRRRPSSESIQ